MGELIADRYEVEKLVGRGGNSSVFKAHDTLLERNVALKILHEHHLEDEEYIERFKREARTVAHSRHPNIVTVIDRGETDGRPFIVFEYVDGHTLDELIDRRGALPIDEALEIAIASARGLAFAHRHGLVHRDVKPQNILLNGDRQPKVTDFGIARSLDVKHGRHADRHRARHVQLHRAGAGQRRTCRRRERRLLTRRRAVRAAHRPRPVRGRQLRRRCDEAHQRAGAERERASSRCAAARRGGRRPRAREGSARPVRLDGRVRRRARGVPGGGQIRRRRFDRHRAEGAGAGGCPAAEHSRAAPRHARAAPRVAAGARRARSDRRRGDRRPAGPRRAARNLFGERRRRWRNRRAIERHHGVRP